MQISLRIMNEKHELVSCRAFKDEKIAHEAFDLLRTTLKGTLLSPHLLFDFRDEQLNALEMMES